MTQYIISYIGGHQPSTPEEGKHHFAKYKKWLASLGDSAVSPANPLKDTRTVHPDGAVTIGSTTSMSGYTIVDVEIYRGNPGDCESLSVPGPGWLA